MRILTAAWEKERGNPRFHREKRKIQRMTLRNRTLLPNKTGHIFMRGANMPFLTMHMGDSN
jgi:hypothetical protein